MMRIVALVALVAVVALAALAGCSDDFPKTFLDAGSDPCNGNPTFDGGVVGCPVPEVLDPVLVLPGEALRDDQGATIVSASYCASPHLVSVQLYPGRGTLAAGAVVGTYDLAEEPLDFATCGACVRLLADVDGHGAPTATYMATSGQLQIVNPGSVSGDPIAVALTNVALVEVTIDPISFATTAVNPGCASLVTGITVQAPVRQLP